MTEPRRNVITEADSMFNSIAQRRNKERREGLNNVRSVYGTPMPQFGKYKVR